MTIQKKKVIGYSLFTIFLWASAYPLTKIAQTHFTVVPLAFLRSFIAGSFMLFIGKFQGMALPKKKHIPLFLLAGALGYVIYTVAMNIGLQTLPSATCSLLVATSPIMTAIIASKVYREKIGPVSWISIFIAFSGRPFLEIGSTEFIIHMLLKNTGISFLPEFTIRREVEQKRLTALKVRGFQMQTWRQIFYHKNKFRTREMEQFITFASEEENH